MQTKIIIVTAIIVMICLLILSVIKIMSLFKSIFYKSPLDAYSSIDELPVYNWQKINAMNDRIYLLKNAKDVKLSPSQLIQLNIIWDKIICEFIDKIGMPPNMQKILFLKRDIIALKAKLYLSGNQSLQTMIEIKQSALNALLGGDNKIDGIEKTVGLIEENFHVIVDIRTCSVLKFYNTYVKRLQEKSRIKQKQHA